MTKQIYDYVNNNFIDAAVIFDILRRKSMTKAKLVSSYIHTECCPHDIAMETINKAIAAGFIEIENEECSLYKIGSDGTV